MEKTESHAQRKPYIFCSQFRNQRQALKDKLVIAKAKAVTRDASPLSNTDPEAFRTHRISLA